MKQSVKPGRFAKFRTLVVRCSKDDRGLNTCEVCTKEWNDLGYRVPCTISSLSKCVYTFGWHCYPRPIKGHNYSPLKLSEP